MANDLVQWVGPGVAVVLAVGAAIANIYLVGRFVGRAEATMAALGTRVDQGEKRVDELQRKSDQRFDEIEELADSTEVQRALMEGRLQTVEAVLEKFWLMRDEFIAMRTTVELTSKSTGDRLDSVGRNIAGIERQIANLVTGRAGTRVLEITDSET